MPLDPAAKRFLDMMAVAASDGRSPSTLDERRRAFAKLMRLARADVTEVTGIDGAMPGPAGDIPYRLYAPVNDVTGHLPDFVFFHGGGMVGGSIETHDRVAAALAQTTGCRVVSVDYRLAPEHKFPAAIEDAVTSTKWVSEHAPSLGIDVERLLVGGDSAGATLAAVVSGGVAKRRPGNIRPMPDLSGTRFRGNFAVARSVRRKPSARNGHAGSGPRSLSAGRR
jgi:acetyl esterase/lipase